MTNTHSDRLGTDKVSKLFFKLALPSIIAQLINVIYNIVDRVYIGRIEDSELAMSALSVALPIITIIQAFNMLLGTGGAPLVAMRLGQKDKDGAEKILTNSFVMLTMTAIFLTVSLFIFQEPLLYLFGASAENIALAKDYVGIYLIGTIFVMYAVGLNPYISTQGRSSFAMATVIIGAVLNIILDPLFIFVFDMGVRGAALATILAQSVSAIAVLSFFFSGKSEIKIKKKYLLPDLKIVGRITALGVSPFIMSMTEAILQIAFNNQLKLYGGTLAVGTKAILASIYQFLLLTTHGMTQGAGPIISYNYGAKNYKRARDTFKILLRSAVLFSIIFITIVLLFPTTIASLFTDSQNSIEFTSWAIRPYFLGALFYGFQISCQQSFLALGEAKRSIAMATFRKVIMLIPLVYLLPHLIGDSSFAISMGQPIEHLVYDSGRVFAVLFAESIADFTATVTTSTVFYFFYKKTLCNDDGML